MERRGHRRIRPPPRPLPSVFFTGAFRRRPPQSSFASAKGVGAGGEGSRHGGNTATTSTDSGHHLATEPTNSSTPVKDSCPSSAGMAPSPPPPPRPASLSSEDRCHFIASIYSADPVVRRPTLAVVPSWDPPSAGPGLWRVSVAPVEHVSAAGLPGSGWHLLLRPPPTGSSSPPLPSRPGEHS
uniref:Uncharacterized protein n=1 Tax=Oryza sativa subsp. japonica TaxID=39947 RepID=Q8L673_ORYSJ|nr:hypothetical protein [Oryza sativa Japonica Group]